MPHRTSSLTMPVNVGETRAQLVEQVRKAPRSPTPSDPVAYLGSPVPVLGLRVPTLRTIWRARRSPARARAGVCGGGLDKPLQVLEKLLHDEEFWVQRAVGTWLRECWKQNRPRAEAFLRGHIRGLPRVVITVATERAPKALRDLLRRGR